MLSKFFRKILNRYESSSMLRNYVYSQYGPFLKEPYFKSERLYQEIIKSATEFITEDTKVLDVGCAIGRLVFEYEKLGRGESVGIDTSEKFIKFAESIKAGQFAHEFNFEIKENSKAKFICDDIFTTKKLGERYFDFISCVNVVDRVPNPFLLVEKIHELLKSDGILLLVDPYHWSLSPAPRKYHVSDIKELLDENKWQIIAEKKGIEYTIPISEHNELDYKCHMVFARKLGI